MSRIITHDEVLDALRRRGHPQAETLVRATEAIATLAAEALAQTLGCDLGETDFAPGFGGTATAFRPTEACPHWPADLSDLDPDENAEGEFPLAPQQEAAA